MIAIIDYGAGNLKSVQKAFEHLGYQAVITKDKEKIKQAQHVVLPGVGAFGEAMNKLNASDLISTIFEVIDAGTPFLGICLGLQLLFEYSEESPGAKGLGLFQGGFIKIPSMQGLKIPHMGWNSIAINRNCKLFDGVHDEAYVYFVHSYYLKAQDPSVVCATTQYGVPMDVGVCRDNVYAFQFHPEKSSDVGLNILQNFARLTKEEN